MRFQGKIKSWNQVKGFGFISPNSGGKDIFVRISEFNKIHRRPSINSLVTYEVSNDEKNRQQAKNIKLVGDKNTLDTYTRKGQHLFFTSIIKIIITGFIIFIIIDIYQHRGSTLEASFYKSVFERDYQKSDYICEGKTYCSEMTSCGEALFYQENCTGTAMDGNHDGIPCEQQWCN